MILFSLALAAQVGLAGAPAVDAASAVGTAVDGAPRITLSLRTDVASVAPGESFHVGVQISMAPGWHIYWHNPGAAGFATELAWRSGDVSIGATAWPAPAAFNEREGILTYGYADDVLLTADALVSDSVAGSISVEVAVRYLACNVICSPGEVQLRQILAVGPLAQPADAASLQLFADARARLPQAAADLGVRVDVQQAQTPLRPGDGTRLALQLQRCAGAGPCAPLQARGEPFIPAASPGLQLQAMAAPAPGPPTLWLQVDADADADVLPDAIDAVLALQQDGQPLPPLAVHLPLQTGARGAAVSTSAAPVFAQTLPMPAPPSWALQAAPQPWWRILLLALLGGMVLNLMPCVLPVLGIKLLALTQAGQLPRRQALAHAGAYAAGVMGSMLLLAGVVIGLRQVGTQVGWGFQFQEPGFVAAISTVLVLFSLNCFGVFEIDFGGNALASQARRHQGLARSVWEGVLAVALATPCSAPFLGTAVAFALSRGPGTIAAVFLTIGAGLTAPYVALVLLPGQRRWLPRPGAWMLHLKTLLGFGLMGTAIWLVWLIGRFGGIDAMARLLVYLLGISLVAWLYGVLVARHPAHPLPFWAGLLALLAGIAGIALAMRPEPPMGAPMPGDLEHALTWRPYQHPAVLAELAAGHPVFVEFTADWCITCKFNERRVLRGPQRAPGLRRHPYQPAAGRLDPPRPQPAGRAGLLRPRRRAHVPALQPAPSQRSRAAAGAA